MSALTSPPSFRVRAAVRENPVRRGEAHGPMEYELLQRYRNAACAVPTVLGMRRSALSDEVLGAERSAASNAWAMRWMLRKVLAGSVGRGSR
ncbi:hypothetical protein [Nocardia vinacea]|uniref:hypothetical protein n=1 Tax=Nocardia vinacea TaxID=96468 RepID=UPI0002E51E13|nr:hypothetical protein [Nocardia vinacea]